MNIHVAAIALNTTPIDWQNNVANIVSALKVANTKGVQLAVLPELCITGYGCEDLFFHPFVRETALEILLNKLPVFAEMTFTVGLPLEYSGALYNVAAVVTNGQIKGFYAKQNLAGDGVHYEPRWFKPWPKGIIVDYRLPTGQFVPLGDTTFAFAVGKDEITFGFEVCEDAWVAERPGIALSKAAVDLILNPSASHFAFGKSQTRELFVLDGSRTFNCAYIYANLLGNEAGRIVFDGECLIANGGQLIAKGRRFGYVSYRITDAVVDLSVNRFNRLRSVSFHSHSRPTTAVGKLVEKALRKTEPMPPPTSMWDEEYAHIDLPLRVKVIEFLGAQTLALFDFVRKTRTNGFVISKSGGADSAMCAFLVHEMVRLGVLSTEDQAAFKQVFRCGEGEGPQAITNRLLTLIYQGTSNSSDYTLNAAGAVAKDTGARFMVVNVDSLVTIHEEFLKEYLGRDISWDKDDLTRQNIQARVRSTLPWSIANAENKLNITTSNRSEAAVGYCTMDGDTAGSIGPLGGVDKAFVIQVLEAMRPRYSSIKIVRGKPSTAELKPASANQTDEKDLMPYPVLDAIEQASILGGKTPAEIVDAGIASAEHTIKFFNLFARNQWKRERYAPSFMLDSRNLDPRSFTRFPILNGGFRAEIGKLHPAPQQQIKES
jgi:NAD+ synthase (glutamine-hydrolysing)